MLTKTFKDIKPFQSRRSKLKDLAPDSVFILFAGQERHLTPFRVNSSFLYLTGFEEPEAVAVISTGQNAQFTLFVRDKDPSVELWDGERFGPEKAKNEFGADQCFAIEQLSDCLPGLLKEAQSIYFSLGEDATDDDLVIEARNQAQQLDRRSGQAKKPIADPNEILARMRMVKDAQEIELMRESCEISAQAHIRVMQNVRPGLNEKQVLADFLYSIYQQKASREGYSSIVASGANACTLHYRENTRDMLNGEFLLIDAGGEKSYYTADITRTYPINGKFTEPQKKLYQAVLEVQKKLIDCVQVGFSLPELHEKSCEWLCEQMIQLGLLKGELADHLHRKSFQKYYPHGVGHFLGLDVHDVGLSKINGALVPFVAGVVVTVEPGIYVPVDDSEAPEEYRGLGVRIEDDVLVTEKGPDVLTASAPKEVVDLERIVGAALV